MTYRAVLFDLDGTLADTLQDLAAAMNWTLQQLGLPTHSIEAYRSWIGGGSREMTRKCVPQERHDNLDEVYELMTKRYSEHQLDTTRLYPGIAELLDGLCARDIKLSVLSNKNHPSTVAICDALLYKWPIAAVYGARAEVPIKPDPSGADDIVSALEVPARQFVYLGDTDIDMQTAVAANMYPVGVLWGFRNAEELNAAGARLLLNHPTELLDFLDRSATAE